jgi:hypothetical protein
MQPYRPKGYIRIVFFPEVNIILKVSLVSINDVEKANPSRGGGAKSWICQTDAYRLADRQTAEIFWFGGFNFVKEVFEKINARGRLYCMKVLF